MHLTELSPVGVQISDLSLRDLDTATIATLRGLLAEHGVAVFRDQFIDDDAFLALLREFGDLLFTAGETPLPGYPDLNMISNVGRATPPRSVFHIDTTYVSRPPQYTALRAVRIPARGGQTLFTNQYRAHDTLPPDVRERLRDRAIKHVVTGVDPGDAQEHEAWHPALRPHPLTGRVALYLSTPQRCVAVSDMPDAPARELIDFLYRHSTTPGNTLRHTWRPGDVVIWDNGVVLHRADHDGVVGDRVMHRGMVVTP
jgi:taurine dioxygenase